MRRSLKGDPLALLGKQVQFILIIVANRHFVNFAYYVLVEFIKSPLLFVNLAIIDLFTYHWSHSNQHPSYFIINLLP